jgi:hypothetical protein
MKSYETIKEISNGLYLNLQNEDEISIRLQNSVQKIHKQISADFKSMFGEELYLQDYQIYIDDNTYRQSATGLILNEILINNADFKIRIECLIDHGRIWLKVKQGEGIFEFADIINRIGMGQNSEGLSELRDIR